MDRACRLSDQRNTALLIAYMIVRIALGFGGDADQTGALATLANSGGGAMPL